MLFLQNETWHQQQQNYDTIVSSLECGHTCPLDLPQDTHNSMYFEKKNQFPKSSLWYLLGHRVYSTGNQEFPLDTLSPGAWPALSKGQQDTLFAFPKAVLHRTPTQLSNMDKVEFIWAWSWPDHVSSSLRILKAHINSITLLGCLKADFSSQSSCGSFLKSFNPFCLQLLKIWLNQSASFEAKEAVQFNCTKKGWSCTLNNDSGRKQAAMSVVNSY